MKKLTAIILVTALILSLAACGGGGQAAQENTASQGNTASQNDAPLTRNDSANENSSESGTQENTADQGQSSGEAFDFSSIANGTPTYKTVLSAQSEADKLKLVADGKANGYDVTFESDGSTVLTYTDGTVMVQDSKGNWSVKDADGSQTQVGGGWPDNEFTKLLPVPEMTVTGTEVTENGFTAVFIGADADSIKAYAEKVKAKGFVNDAHTEDQQIAGVTIYNYTASNSDGYTVEVFFASGSGGINLTKDSE